MNTKIVYKKDIDLMVDEIKKGKIIAFPTDTVFGLACIYDNEEAIKKIYEAKDRDFNKSLPMMVNNLTMLKKYAYINDNSKKIIKNLMPGALTIILNKKNIPAFVSDKETIAVRIPDDKWVRSLIRKVNKPLLVTSANISNTSSLIKYSDVYHDLKDKIDYVVKGNAKTDVSSTIVDARNELKILREGKISLKDIMEVLK